MYDRTEAFPGQTYFGVLQVSAADLEDVIQALPGCEGVIATISDPELAAFARAVIDLGSAENVSAAAMMVLSRLHTRLRLSEDAPSWDFANGQLVINLEVPYQTRPGMSIARYAVATALPA